MKVLFDQGTPVPLRRALPGHAVSTAYEMGWASLTNGEFLRAAEAEGFEVLVTTDKNLRHQQNLAGRNLGVLVLPTTDWAKIRRHSGRVASALAAVRPGEINDVDFG
jgi:predicted nuclease of predicted toxin-antitoxin system